MKRRAAGCLLLVLLSKQLDSLLAAPVVFQRVPTVSDVPPTDLKKLQDCLSKCAVNPNNLITAFSANSSVCTFDGSGGNSGCQIDKRCFEACFNQGLLPVYENRGNPQRTAFYIEPGLPNSLIKAGSFGKIRDLVVDGAVFAQPLYAPDVVVNGSIVNVLFAATEHASVYAFNADTGDKLWQRNFLGDAQIFPTDFVPPCYDIAPEWGITSTPYIDPNSSTIYVLPWTKEKGQHVYRIHALDLATGADKFGRPTTPISASKTFPDKSTATFDAAQQVQRPGLAVYKGVLYVGFGSRCDATVYYFWLMAYDATSLQQKQVHSMPYSYPGEGPGLWQGGAGPVFFNDSMYVVVGNGAFQPSKGLYADSVLRLSLPDLSVIDSFTPSDQAALSDVDLDLGSAAAIPVKDKYVFTGGKGGSFYLLKANALGGYNASNNNGNAFQFIPAAAAQDPTAGIGGIYSGAAYWPAGSGQLFVHGVRSSPLQKYAFGGGDKLSLAASSPVVGNFSKRGSVPVVSAVSADATQAVVWEVDNSDVLYAWDAGTLSALWNSASNSADKANCQNWVKFATPTVAGGKVFIGCGSKVVVYGLK